jgi:hypothetical protein
MAGGQSAAPPAPDHLFDLHGRKRIVELHDFESIGAGFQLGQARLQISAHRGILVGFGMCISCLILYLKPEPPATL